VTPKLSPELQQFAFQIGMKLVNAAEGVSAAEIGLDHESKLVRWKRLASSSAMLKGGGNWS